MRTIVLFHVPLGTPWRKHHRVNGWTERTLRKRTSQTRARWIDRIGRASGSFETDARELEQASLTRSNVTAPARSLATCGFAARFRRRTSTTAVRKTLCEVHRCSNPRSVQGTWPEQRRADGTHRRRRRGVRLQQLRLRRGRQGVPAEPHGEEPKGLQGPVLGQLETRQTLRDGRVPRVPTAVTNEPDISTGHRPFGLRLHLHAFGLPRSVRRANWREIGHGLAPRRVRIH